MQSRLLSRRGIEGERRGGRRRRGRGRGEERIEGGEK